MGIGDWGLGIGDWAQSPIPNPQSPIPNPHNFSYIIFSLKNMDSIISYIYYMEIHKTFFNFLSITSIDSFKLSLALISFINFFFNSSFFSSESGSFILYLFIVVSSVLI